MMITQKKRQHNPTHLHRKKTSKKEEIAKGNANKNYYVNASEDAQINDEGNEPNNIIQEAQESTKETMMSILETNLCSVQ